jgi:MFS family permease
LLASDANSAPNGGRNSKPSVGILAVVTHPEHYKAIIAVISVMFAQQFTGINGVMMYSVSFLSVILPTGATLITVMVGALNLVVTIACAPLSDRVGRKRCLLLSIFSMSVNSVLLAVGIINGYQALAAVATLLFVASFAVGLGPVPFILASELVGPEAVGATQSWALAANWFATFLVAQFFPMLNDFLGQGKVFFVFAAMGAALFAFIAWWVPETLGKTADEAWGRGERDRRED